MQRVLICKSVQYLGDQVPPMHFSRVYEPRRNFRGRIQFSISTVLEHPLTQPERSTIETQLHARDHFGSRWVSMCESLTHRARVQVVE